jgi:hypothetical protein
MCTYIIGEKGDWRQKQCFKNKLVKRENENKMIKGICKEVKVT